MTHAKFLPFKKTRGGDDLWEAEAEVGNGAYAMFAADMVSRCTSSKHMWKMFTCRVWQFGDYAVEKYQQKQSEKTK